MKKIIAALLLCVFVISIFTGCEKNSGDTSGAINTKETVTESLAPVIKEIAPFFKKDTALNKSDVIDIYIRNVSYSFKEEKFDKEFKVYLDNKEQTFHDVNILGYDYYVVVVDISVTTGTVYITYGGVQSNSVDFILE